MRYRKAFENPHPKIFRQSKRPQNNSGMRPFRALTFTTCLLTSLSLSTENVAWGQIKTAVDLVEAVNNGQPNTTVVIGAGTFELSAPLKPKTAMKLRGAGIGKTIIRNTASWTPGNAGLENDEGAQKSAIACNSYLVNLGENTTDVSLSAMTLTGPQLHGAICGITPHRLELMQLEIKFFLWAGLRTFIMDGARIHDNLFEDAGGKSNITTGSSGGGLFLTYTKDANIHDNRFKRSAGNDYYGIKGREARNVHIHHNSIETDFAIEFPFENDHFVEIDHNYLGGTISIPKHGGGSFPAGGYSFHVHHNYFKTSYAFEYHRGGIEIDHNLFDFSTTGDYGNLISGFDQSPVTEGGTSMHDNLIHNPGRGLYWNEGIYNNFAFFNNHVKAETTVTPRTEGLFDFRPERNGVSTDWKTIAIRDNIFECKGTSRPLLRNDPSHTAVIENNTFINIKDAATYANRDTGKKKGSESLAYRLGAEEEWTIKDWTISKTQAVTPQGGTGGSVAPGTGGAVGTAGMLGTTGSGGANAGGSTATTDSAGGSEGTIVDSAGSTGNPSSSDHVSGSCSVIQMRNSRRQPYAWMIALAALLVLGRRSRRKG